MKKVAIYILAVVSLCLASCISLEDSFISTDQGGQNLKIMASVADFSNVNVGTKALEEEESKVNEITMIIFDSNNNIVGRPVNLHGANSFFMIDTQNAQIIDGVNPPINMVGGNVTQTTLNACSIYMVANCWHVLEYKTISTLSNLMDIDIPVEAIGIPKTGIPMIGSQEGFDLSSDRSSTASTLADIVMKKLYAKVNVRFQVNSNQVIKIPSFTLQSWTVSGIPTAVRLGEPAEGEQTANAEKETLETTDPSSVLSYGMSTIMHSESAVNPEYFQFTFYVPEHRVNPNNTVTYPDGILEVEKQRYKPLLCKEPRKPMYVTVNGIYSDHHGQVREVTYSLYLGQNNSDNFHVKRNQELNNIVTITGLTNSKPENEEEINISVDHRVEVTSNKGYSIAVEREALLDSHFEVRPMDVFVSAGGKVVLTVNSSAASDDGDDWLRMEESIEDGGVSHIAGVGVRNYFTSDLVTKTLAEDGRSITITENSRIWLYFDENTNVYDKTIEGSPKHRDITLKVDYYAPVEGFEPENLTTVTESQEFSFRQINLWRVRNLTNTRYYDIEYHEEYLYNYVSDDNYGKRKDGMVWGLDGIQLSHIYDACYLNASNSNFWQWLLSLLGWDKEDLVNASFNQLDPKPKYDFYLSRDTQQAELTVRDFSGYDFNSEITTYLKTNYGSDDKAKLTGIVLTEDPKSAVAYCYNKNKRNANGEVEQLSWYLPASDEIEEIASSAYQEFDGVFQGNMYWSCQPAYVYSKLDADLFKRRYEIFGEYIDSNENVNGEYYLDDRNRARATRAQVNEDGNFERILDSGSELKGTQKGIVYVGDKPAELPANKYVISNEKPYEGHPGNLSRTTDYARVRCIRNSGPVSAIDNN